MDVEEARKWLKQGDVASYLTERLGSEQWVPVYQHKSTPVMHAYFFCALIEEALADEALGNPDWELGPGDAMPGVVCNFEGGEETTTYHRYSGREGIEPFVLHRYFHGMRESYREICEEFRLLHNLHGYPEEGMYVKFSQNGEEETVVRERDGQLQVRLKELKEFLAVKRMKLAVYFESSRGVPYTLDGLGVSEVRETISADDLVYRFSLLDRQEHGRGKVTTDSRIRGKKLIEADSSKRDGSFWPLEWSVVDHEEFIVDTDAHGEPVLHTAEPGGLAGPGGANPEAPSALTPIFFKKEVLQRYFSKPQRYDVEDGYVRCGGLWALPIDNNHEDYIVVFLKDLGELPTAEQRYWKSYNVAPDGTISEVTWKRAMEAEFTDPERPDLLFKQRFKATNETWEGALGWPLFKPLSSKDRHLFQSLRVPLTREQQEFDSQVLALWKILVESINVAALKDLEIEYPKEAKGITTLETYLADLGLEDYDKHIVFLRQLHDLRSSGVGHRKSARYEKAVEDLGIDEGNLPSAFEMILNHASDALSYVNDTVLPAATEAHGQAHTQSD